VFYFFLIVPSQSIFGVVNISQSQKDVQISPRQFIINRLVFSLNLFLKVSPDEISKRFIEIEIGKIKSPNPIGPPLVFKRIQVKGTKYKFVKMIIVDIVQFAVFNSMSFFSQRLVFSHCYQRQGQPSGRLVCV
jgi:hypothetical protein